MMNDDELYRVGEVAAVRDHVTPNSPEAVRLVEEHRFVSRWLIPQSSFFGRDSSFMQEGEL